MRTSFDPRFAISIRRVSGLAIAMAFLLSLTAAPGLAHIAARAQTVHGIPSAGTDFYLSRMPPIPNAGWRVSWNGNQAGYFLIGSEQNGNRIWIDYSTTGVQKDGSHFAKSAPITLDRGICRQIQIDPNSMTPDRPGEELQWRSAHIHSDYPITVQYYCEGTSSGSLYQGVPTQALGKDYVISAWNDNPYKDSPSSNGPDSTSSEFMVIAPYDNTNVTITPNSTTYSGVVGFQSGMGSDGFHAHPITINMMRGQIYWVRSLPDDMEDDLSGTTVVADKPVAVIAGQERGLVDDPGGSGGYGNDEDERDAMVEEMTPIESWGTEYPSIPTMPASNSSCNSSGDGDLYRLYSADPINGMAVDMWDETSLGQQKYGPQSIANSFQLPPANWQNVTDPVDLVTDSLSLDASGHFKKTYAVEYQYFQWTASNEMNYRSANEMDLIPIGHFIKSTVFMVPKDSHYNGFQFINIITNRDSLSKIFMTENGTSTGTLNNFIPPVKEYQSIPFHPELIGLTYKLGSGDYMIYGNTPFACYTYGRTELTDKAVAGYAAPCGQAYGSHDLAAAPKAVITPSCGAWHVDLSEPNLSGNDGIADVRLLDDPNGLYAQPPRVSTKGLILNPQNPTQPPFEVGDNSLSFDVLVQNPGDTADAYIYVVDRAGNDTVIHLHYVPSQFSFAPNTIQFADTAVGSTQSRTITFHVVSTGNFSTVQIPPAFLMGLDTSKDFSFTSNPTLPAMLKVGDSIVFTVQFSAIDTNFHKDSLVLSSTCLDDTVALMGRESTPIIWAQDYDFGKVPVGDTVCHNIYVENLGNANLVLTKEWVLEQNPDYTFEGSVPDTIKPDGKYDSLFFCFHPGSTGPSNSQMNWGTNLNILYANEIKDSSVLLGYGMAPGMNWNIPKDTLTVECDAYDTSRVYLKNPSSATAGENVTVNDIHFTGPNASEFTILDYNGNPYSSFAPFQLLKNDSIPVDVQFKATLANGYVDRSAQLVANGLDVSNAQHTDTIFCVGIVRHANVTITPATYNFGAWTPGTQLTQTFTITNTGDTAFVFTGINLSGTDFKILSGPAIGTSLLPNTTDTFVIQYTAAQTGGTVNATFECTGDHPCTSAMASASGASEAVAVAETVPTYPITYICHYDTSSITAHNAGNIGVILDSVQIVDSAGLYPASSEFTFYATNSQLVIPDTGLNMGETMTFPVKFTPAINYPVTAEAVFYWEDTSKGQQRYFQEIQPITGEGYETFNTVSLQNPVAQTSNSYTAVTAKQVSIPVQLTAPFDSIAQVYGVQFTLRYYRDAFQFQNVVPVAGMTVVNNPQPTPDPADNNYDLLAIHVASTSPIRNSGTFATVNWQYVVAKDSISPFDVKDVMFLDNSGAQVCWVSDSIVPTTFYGLNLCGDATLREYLHGGMPAFSIEGVTPNPVTHTASVYYKVAEDGVPVTMQVFNALGQPVETLMRSQPQAAGAYRVRIDASQLPSGLYTVYISTPGFGISKQVVVTK